MANLKSQIKRDRQNLKARNRNRVYRGSARTFVKKARLGLESGEAATAEQAVLEAVRALDKAAKKGIIHRNNAARRKSRLMKQLARMS